MASWKAIDPESGRRLLGDLLALDWSWRIEDAPGIAERLGWQVLSHEPAAGLVADAGLKLDREEVSMPYVFDAVDEIEVDATEHTGRPTRESMAFLQDTFAALVSTATELAGPPSRRKHGEHPSVHWTGPQNTLLIRRSKSKVLVILMPNEVRARWDEHEEMGKE